MEEVLYLHNGIVFSFLEKKAFGFYRYAVGS